jgi:hypothetical protein
MGIVLVVGLVWCLLALGAAVVVGRAIHVRDLRDPVLCIEGSLAVGEKTRHRV